MTGCQQVQLNTSRWRLFGLRVVLHSIQHPHHFPAALAFPLPPSSTRFPEGGDRGVCSLNPMKEQALSFRLHPTAVSKLGEGVVSLFLQNMSEGKDEKEQKMFQMFRLR